MARLDTSATSGQVQDEAPDETRELISARKVEGTSVYNARGDNLGTVYDIMIDKVSGRVAYAVMSFGGFLGIGEKYHPLPWNMMTYDEEKGGYNIDLSDDQLRRAPAYSASELADWQDRGYGQQVSDYYGSSAAGSSGSMPGSPGTTH